MGTAGLKSHPKASTSERVETLAGAADAISYLMKEWRVKGYYTSRIGLEQLGYPGLTSV
jgi:hypothetical protein